MRWRLGLDLGTNSLGWAAVELDPEGRACRIFAAGTRIFSDGRDAKSGASLAVDRREARAMRRRRDRFKQRQAALIKYLTLAGLFPADDAARAALAWLDPYAVRAAALHAPLPLPHLGRALFHLNQRRGFKSNRKTIRGTNDDDGKIKIGVNRLYEAMRDAGAETLGAYLFGRRAAATDDNAIPSIRARLRPETGDGAKGDGYDFYPDRQMLEDEFDAIWEAQAPHHPAVLTPDARRRLFEVVFHQRPLKKPKIGLCTLMPPEERLPKAHPLFQTRRLLEELNTLKIVRPGAIAQPLTLEQRDLLLLKLKDKRAVTFDSLRKAIKLDAGARFNKESENRKDLKGDEVAAEFGSKTRFGQRWPNLPPETQWEIVSRVIAQESDEHEASLKTWLEDRHGLTPAQAEATVGARLPEGFGRFGLTATTGLIKALRADVVEYSKAVLKAGLGHHSDFRTGEVHDTLPYYGAALERYILPGKGEPSDEEETRIGRLTNPTVHIGLNQLRRVVNALIKRYGKPEQIAIELARELKLNDERKQEINTRNRKNREDAERRSRSLIETFGARDSGANRALLKLWEELNPDNVLDRRCVYTGQMISPAMLFSGAVEVDHILPFSATLDNSNGNLLLCTREANRRKAKRSPHEAFGQHADWAEIVERAAKLPREKRWRFEPDAMSRFSEKGDFLDRQLVDTQYLSRLARSYLCALYGDAGEGSSRVWASPGRLTEMLRRNWELNHLLPDHNFAGSANQPKNRSDHRHHAIDAAVIAVTDRGMLQRIAHEAGQRGHEAADRMTKGLPTPWSDFMDELREIVKEIVVSHRPDHGLDAKQRRAKGQGVTAGRLHNDTAYGLTQEKDSKGNDLVVHRISITALKTAGDIGKVRDVELRTALLAWTEGLTDKAFAARLLTFRDQGPPQFRGLRRVRIKEPLSVIPIHDKTGRAYKGYKGDSNFRYDVWELKDGKWVAEVISMFEAHQPGWVSAIRQNNPTARKVLSLHQDDLLAVETEAGTRKLVRIAQFEQGGQITLAEPQEGGNLRDRNRSPDDPFKYFAPTASGLKKIKARQVKIDELGSILDPGPRDRVAKSP
jgi:CRISPR-associated endonuclease Csn1